MGFDSVFRTLQVLFPQVDVRILKAVAIEHDKDVNDAAEAILLEVLPTISGPRDVLFTFGVNSEAEEEETILLKRHEAVEANTVHPSETRSVACNTASGNDHTSDTSSVKSAFSDEAVAGSMVSSARGVNDLEELLAHNDKEEITSSVKSAFSDEAVAGSMVSSARGVNDLEELFVHNDKEEITSFAEKQEVNLLNASSSYSSSGIPSSAAQKVAIISDHSTVALHSDIHDLSGETSYVSLPSSICIENHHDSQFSGTNSPKGDESDSSFSTFCRGNYQDKPCSNASSPEVHNLLTIQEFELLVHEQKPDDMCNGNVPDKDVSNVARECKEPGTTSSLASSVEPLISETLNECHLTTITSRSGQTISIDFLEQFISDAKNNKKTLLSAMDSVLNKTREVELREKEAGQAKVEASSAGLNTLTEVENLKEMVHRAKMTNDTHAGEVCGEKSILATEARELQSRLLNISNERDKSLSIIDEIQHTLEERLAATEAEKAAAEKEKIENEEYARKALDEQMLIMDKVVQESKKLQQEAEENAKLREFLMDRGRIVDTLQGEISVICEDVKLLKDRIDGRLPISRSVSSSHISTSSSLSMTRVSSPDPVIKHNILCDSLNMSVEEQLLEGDRSMDMMSCLNHTAPLDDEWVLFIKDETELCH